MKIALILDNNQIEKWQLESLYKCGDEIKIDLILNCQNTKNKRSIFVNFLYYFFNFFLVRNRFRQKFNITKIDFFTKILGWILLIPGIIGIMDSLRIL